MGDAISACCGGEATAAGHPLPKLRGHARLQRDATHLVQVSDLLDAHVVLLMSIVVLVWHSLVLGDLLVHVRTVQFGVPALVVEDAPETSEPLLPHLSLFRGQGVHCWWR